MHFHMPFPSSKLLFHCKILFLYIKTLLFLTPPVKYHLLNEPFPASPTQSHIPSISLSCHVFLYCFFTQPYTMVILPPDSLSRYYFPLKRPTSLMFKFSYLSHSTQLGSMKMCGMNDSGEGTLKEVVIGVSKAAG